MSRPRGHPDNSIISSLGSDISWANTEDRTARTTPARDKFRDSFLEQAREKFGDDLEPDDLARRAEHLRRAHYKRLALRSAQARRKRAGRPSGTEREAA